MHEWLASSRSSSGRHNFNQLLLGHRLPLQQLFDVVAVTALTRRSLQLAQDQVVVHRDLTQVVIHGLKALLGELELVLNLLVQFAHCIVHRGVGVLQAVHGQMPEAGFDLSDRSLRLVLYGRYMLC